MEKAKALRKDENPKMALTIKGRYLAKANNYQMFIGGQEIPVFLAYDKSLPSVSDPVLDILSFLQNDKIYLIGPYTRL